MSYSYIIISTRTENIPKSCRLLGFTILVSKKYIFEHRSCVHIYIGTDKSVR